MNMNYPKPNVDDPDPKRTLTVGELIKELGQYDPNAPVVKLGDGWITGTELTADGGFSDADRDEKRAETEEFVIIHYSL